MVGKDSDDKIQKITKLLEKGGTMLATHHECGAPMFRYQGKIVCPVCDFQEKKQVIELQETGKMRETADRDKPAKEEWHSLPKQHHNQPVCRRQNQRYNHK